MTFGLTTPVASNVLMTTDTMILAPMTTATPTTIHRSQFLSSFIFSVFPCDRTKRKPTQMSRRTATRTAMYENICRAELMSPPTLLNWGLRGLVREKAVFEVEGVLLTPLRLTLPLVVFAPLGLTVLPVVLTPFKVVPGEVLLVPCTVVFDEESLMPESGMTV